MFMPIILLIFALIIIYFIFGRGGFSSPSWHKPDRGPSQTQDSESAIAILKKRYAKGEITKEEFEQIKNDLEA